MVKTYIIICTALFLSSCNNAQIEELSNSYAFQEISESLGEDYKDIVKDMKTAFLQNENTKSSPNYHNPIKTFVSEIDKYRLSSLSYYKFDNKKFYDAPSEENLLKCMIPQKRLNIIAERNGNIEGRFLIEKKDGFWSVSEFMPGYGNVISWLCDSLHNAGTKTCRIFVLGSSREFITYKKNNKNLYFRITGDPIPAPRLCEYFVNQYNQGLEQKKYIEEHPEMFAPFSPANNKN